MKIIEPRSSTYPSSLVNLMTFNLHRGKDASIPCTNPLTPALCIMFLRLCFRGRNSTSVLVRLFLCPAASTWTLKAKAPSPASLPITSLTEQSLSTSPCSRPLHPLQTHACKPSTSTIPVPLVASQRLSQMRWCQRALVALLQPLL